MNGQAHIGFDSFCHLILMLFDFGTVLKGILQFCKHLQFKKYLAKVSSQGRTSVPSALGSFRIQKRICTSETACPATSDTAHGVHKTSRAGKCPLFFLAGADSHTKPKSRHFQFSKTGQLCLISSKRKPHLLHDRENVSVPLRRTALSMGTCAF